MSVPPLQWMRAVRDHEPKAPANSSRYGVLFALALRMNKNGTGFCSRPQLAADVVVGVRTVERHLKWARDNDYLKQTRRGHRITGDTVIASEWALTQPATGVAPRGLLPVGPHPSAHARDGNHRVGGKPYSNGAGNGFDVGDEGPRPLKTCPDCDRAFRPKFPSAVRCTACSDKAMSEYTKNAAMKSGIPKCQVCRKPLTIRSEWDSRIYCPHHYEEWKAAMTASKETP